MEKQIDEPNGPEQTQMPRMASKIRHSGQKNCQVQNRLGPHDYIETVENTDTLYGRHRRRIRNNRQDLKSHTTLMSRS